MSDDEPVTGPSTRDVIRAGALAGAVAGLPSTLWAVLTAGDPLAATRAAGTVLPGRREQPGLVAGVAAHVAVSAAWTVVFGLAARRWRPTALSGALAGLGIAALDLELIGRRYPAIATLPQAPQWADHVAFGAILGHTLGRVSGAGPRRGTGTDRRRRGPPG